MRSAHKAAAGRSDNKIGEPKGFLTLLSSDWETSGKEAVNSKDGSHEDLEKLDEETEKAFKALNVYNKGGDDVQGDENIYDTMHYLVFQQDSE